MSTSGLPHTSTRPLLARPQVYWPIIVLLAFLCLGTRGLFDPDEGRYTNVALNMLSSGNWLVPHRSFEMAHWTKPPLTYWTLATSFLVFGINSWAARMPLALAYLASAWLVGRMARRLSPDLSLPAPLIYAVMLLPAMGSQVVSTDMLLTACELLAVFGYVEYRWGDGRLRWNCLMFAGFGLAFLAKGPPGLLPVLGIVATEILARQPRRMWTLSGIGVFLAVALPWYLAVVATVPGLFDYFVGKEVVNRVAGSDFGRHSEWYGWLVVYLPTLLLGTLPWSIPALREGARKLRNAWHTGYRNVTRAQAIDVFLLAWLLLPLIVFCVSRSRLPLYVLPLMAPVALMAGQRLGMRHRLAWPALWLWIVLLAAFRVAGPWVASHQDARLLSKEIIARVAGSGPIDEVIFVDDTPRYGLRLYLDADVEVVSLDARLATAGLNPAVDESLASELNQPDVEEAVWLTPVEHWPRVDEAMRKHGFTSQTLGTPLQGRTVFRVSRASRGRTGEGTL